MSAVKEELISPNARFQQPEVDEYLFDDEPMTDEAIQEMADYYADQEDDR